jgi:hypothetical protein
MKISTQPTTQTLYDQDYYLWLRTTINQLRTGKFFEVDLENLLEELETMGRKINCYRTKQRKNCSRD